MDVTIEVMLPARGASDFSTSANTRYRVLAPVAVYFPQLALETVGMQRTGYVHVNNVPRPAGWAQWSNERVQRRLTEILCEAWSTSERRIWQGDHTAIGAGARSTLLTERQITVGWVAFKAAWRHLVRETTLTDDDLS